MTTQPINGSFFGMRNFNHPSPVLESHLPVGASLILRAQPDNAYDPNAIQVLVMGSEFPMACHESLEAALAGYGFQLMDILDSDEPWHLGYIPKEYAAEMKSRGFPDDEPWPGFFSVSPSGKSLVRFEEDW